MTKVLFKAAAGVILGLLLIEFARASQHIGMGEGALYLLWGVGMVSGFDVYIRWLSGALNVSLKIGLLSWLSLGSGLVGLLLMIAVLLFVLSVGWIYGWIVLLRDLAHAL